jgi:hypothetical protein
MDRFVTIIPQKENGEIIGRNEYIKNIRNLVSNNNSFCVYGPVGVGKTFLLKHALRGVNYVELTSELLKNDFLERIKNTKIHLLADDLEVTEALSLGTTIIVSEKPVENFNCMKIEPLSTTDIVSIGLKKCPKMDPRYVTDCANDSCGDIRQFLYMLDSFSDVPDLFKSPKDFLYDMVCVGGDIEPRDLLGCSIAEHGYSWGIIHENYPDAPGVDIAQLADYMSYADIKDVDIYSGYSDTHGSIFSLFGVVLPAIAIDHSLDRKTMRPGSAWTKFNNFKMRFRRFKSMTNKKFMTTVDVDSLMVIAQHCKKDPNNCIEMLTAYGFESMDVDMMNHLCLENKIKPRVLQTIKNKLKLLDK